MLVSRLNTSHNRRPHKKAATVKYSGDFVISPGETNGESAIAPMISLLRASYKEKDIPFIISSGMSCNHFALQN
jgi:hypothetical protein